MSAKGFLGVAASAIWNATQRPWLMTFAQILISYSGDQPQDVGEEISRTGDLGYLTGDTALMPDVRRERQNPPMVAESASPAWRPLSRNAAITGEGVKAARRQLAERLSWAQIAR